MDRIYTIDETLSTFASGFAQDIAARSLAEFIAPTVVTGIASGSYKTYGDKNAFSAPDAVRAIGGSATRIGFESGEATYNCTPHALEIPIDDYEKGKAGANYPKLQKAKTRTLVNQAALARERGVFDRAKTLSAVASKGNWSSSEVDPIAEIDEQILAIAAETGMMPNRCVLGLTAWSKLRNNPHVRARQPGAQVVTATVADVSAMLMVPGIDIRVATLSYDTAKPGKAANKEIIAGSEMFLFLASPFPDDYDPSWMKTFAVEPGNVAQVGTYRDDKVRSDIVAVDWTEDVKIVASGAARRITVS